LKIHDHYGYIKAVTDTVFVLGDVESVVWDEFKAADVEELKLKSLEKFHQLSPLLIITRNAQSALATFSLM
jgi:hypothetical protein